MQATLSSYKPGLSSPITAYASPVTKLAFTAGGFVLHDGGHMK
jgi:hypothetical protein